MVTDTCYFLCAFEVQKGKKLSKEKISLINSEYSWMGWAAKEIWPQSHIDWVYFLWAVLR